MRTRFSGEDLNSLSREELYELAQKLELSVRKNSSREKLVEALLPHAQKTAARKAAATKKSSTTSSVKVPDKKSATKSAAPVKKAAENIKTAAPKKSTGSEKSETAKKATASKLAAKKTEVAASAKKRGRPARDEIKDAVAEEQPVARKTTKKAAPAKPVAEKSATVKKGRGRPAKSAVKAPEPVNAPEKKSSDKSAKAVKAVEKPAEPVKPLPKKSPGRPRKSSVKAPDPIVTTEVPTAKKRGRPAKSSVTPAVKPEQAEEPVDASACNVSEAAVKGLARGFARKSEDVPTKSRSKKGAEVFKDGVAVPVESAESHKTSMPAADKIERERERRHSSLKTTMEVPIFQPIAPVEAASTISEDELTGDLPLEYGETRIVLQIRDPHWAYAYWEIPRVELKRIELEVGIFEFAHSHFVLRLHNVSQGFSQEIKLSEHARNWYIYLEYPQTVYQVELGMQSPTEGYTFIALSNLVQTPPDRVAESWAAPVLPEPEPETVERLGGHEIAEPPPQSPGIPQITEPAQVYFQSVTGESVPHQGSSDLLAGQRLQAPEQPSGEAPFVSGGTSSFEMPGSYAMPGSFVMPGSFGMPTSPAPTSADWTSPGAGGFGAGPLAAEDDIFLVAAVEVIVYGQVKIGCDLTFQGHPLRVRPDGTFSLRLALPFDSGHSIDLVATDPRTGKTRVIKAAVTLKKS
ncbi:MAG: hypothetical protein CVV42_02060 [Candidatus Riflebacteria bacterium HGW-Riflebacteria-2]|jgi:hypothetical protein|nr:MAG: hypothetical protein CVV42_02060 [Candidatus Riflebacteria bacterium HGW-Riflebacteria-2]